MFHVLAAAALAAAQPAATAPSDPLWEAEQALAAGRLDQARIMIGNSVRAGLSGDRLDRLLADLAFETKDCITAVPRYEALLTKHPRMAPFAERAGICAIRNGDWSRAAALLVSATQLPNASWRAWNARGVAADNLRDWESADASYAQAARLAPDRPELANNVGWSLLLRGRWNEAVTQFERAAGLDPNSPKIANNLELARAAVSEDLPLRKDGESDSDWAARLNDAGMVAHVRGDRKKAIAALAQAIEARSHWYDRAANNLALIQAAN